jgi:Na+-driven multidrug efflux pump
MSKENLEKHELSWSTRPGRELAHRAWPIAVSTLSYSAMSLVGAAFVARVGAAEVAGVGLAATAHFAFLCFAIGALRGAKTLTAQALGAGRVADADRYLGVAVLMALGWGGRLDRPRRGRGAAPGRGGGRRRPGRPRLDVSAHPRPGRAAGPGDGGDA